MRPRFDLLALVWLLAGVAGCATQMTEGEVLWVKTETGEELLVKVGSKGNLVVQSVYPWVGDGQEPGDVPVHRSIPTEQDVR